MEGNGDYIKVYWHDMEIVESYGKEPRDKFMAWFDLVNRADWKYYQVNNLYIARGLIYGATIRGLARQWRWSVGRVRRFLNRLIADNLMHIIRRGGTTIIVLKNHEDLCDTDSLVKQSKEQREGK